MLYCPQPEGCLDTGILWQGQYSVNPKAELGQSFQKLRKAKDHQSQGKSIWVWSRFSPRSTETSHGDKWDLNFQSSEL